MQLYTVVLFLSIFPFARILPISAEVQPYAVVFAAISIFFLRQRIPIHLALILLSCYGLTFLTFLSAQTVAPPPPIHASAATIVAIISGPTIFTYFYLFGARGRDLTILAPALFIFAVGLFQQYFPPGTAKQIILAPLQAIVPRSTIDALTDWDRGVSLIAPEPAMMTPVLFLLFVFAFLLHRTRHLTRSHFIFLVVLLTACGYLSKSLSFFLTGGIVLGTALIFGILRTVQTFLLRAKNSHRTSSFAYVSFAIIIAIVFWPIYETLIPERLITFFRILMSPETLSSALLALNDLSGSRFAVNFVGFYNLAFVLPELGAWSYKFQLLAGDLPFDLNTTSFFQIVGPGTNIKPSSLLAVLLIDAGFLGLMLFILIISPMLYLIGKCFRYGDLGWRPALLSAAVILITIGGFPLTIPGFWAAAGMLAHSIRNDYHTKSKLPELIK